MIITVITILLLILLKLTFLFIIQLQGYYRCNVSNTDKSRISSEAKLSVLSELEGNP